MDFINADHGNFPAKLGQILHKKSLGSYEEYFDLFLRDRLDYGGLGLVSLLGIDTPAWQELRKLVQLVCHERDKRRNNQYESGLEHRHKLVNK